MNTKNYDYEKIKFLKESGYTWKDIGKEFNVSADAINAAYRRKFKKDKLTDQIKDKTIEPKGFCLCCNEPLFKNGQKYCNQTCQNEHKHQLWIINWKNGLESGIIGEYGISTHLKRYIFDKYNNKCYKCGWSEINQYTGNIPLEIEHIDGNFENNQEENLQLLCPNCHSLTSTYKGANRGNGRKERKKYTK